MKYLLLILLGVILFSLIVFQPQESQSEFKLLNLSNPQRESSTFLDLSINEDWEKGSGSFDFSGVIPISQHYELNDNGIECNLGQDFISYLDKNREIAVCELNRDISRDNVIKGSAYCGYWPSFANYGILIQTKPYKFELLKTIDEIREFFAPVDSLKEAAAYVLIEQDNIDLSEVFAKETNSSFIVKLMEVPSDCSCGDVSYYELIYKVSYSGDVSLIDKKKIKSDYRNECIG
ncbi:hypothetical protein K9M79_05805 [Candidatus Woesearchaeota archaeon]|nr:hypothetical protein [Candidatus Woesearchaeota archaeon]